MRLVWSAAFVLALNALGYVTDFHRLQLVIVFATLPLTVLFIAGYWPERPWRNWFGASLLNLAFAVLSLEAAALTNRITGRTADVPTSLWLSFLITTWIAYTFVAMFQRTAVLLVDQARDRMGFGWFLVRHTSRIYHTFVGR
jgi:hypothetical protein